MVADPDLIGGLSAWMRSALEPVAPAEQILQRQGDAELVVDGVQHFAIGAGGGGGRIIAELRRIDGEVLAVVDEAPALDVAVIVDDEARPADLVSRGAVELDALAVVGDDVEASLRVGPSVLADIR